MYALTLWQPWAGVVASGLKLVENRPWAPPAFLMGHRFAIHAGQRFDKASAEHLRSLRLPADPLTPPHLEIRGAVVATARLRAVVTHIDEVERILGPDQRRWFFGPFGWLLEDVSPLARPIRCRGYQKLWNLPPPVAIDLLWGQP